MHERITFHSQRKNHLLVHLTEVDLFGNYSSPHYKGTAIFYKVTRGQLEWRDDKAVLKDTKLLGDPVCKLSLTLPKVKVWLHPLTPQKLNIMLHVKDSNKRMLLFYVILESEKLYSAHYSPGEVLWGHRWVKFCSLAPRSIHRLFATRFNAVSAPDTKTCIIYPSPAHPTRFPLRLSSSLAVRGALRGGNGPAGALPATLPQHRSAGDDPSRERRPLFPCLHHPGHVEERAARRPEPTQGLSARLLLGQDRQAGSGQRTAAEAGCSYQAGVTELRRPRKERSHCLLSAAFNMSQATGSQCCVWSTRGQHRTRRVSALLWACNPTFCFCFGSCLRCKV